MAEIKRKPELMAPAGDWTMLYAALNSGADAVYFGVEKLNMRAKAANFTLDELPAIVKTCREKNAKSYLTLNTIIKEEEIEELKEVIKASLSAGVDKVICWDFAAAQLCRELGMPFCISTQGSAANSLSVNFYKSTGASRVVLARECSLKEIKEIKSKTDIEIEVFIHGAMCIAVSGRCFMSHHLFGKSANQGECIQPCRREFEIYDPTIKKSMIIGEDYVLSPKDLCTVEFIDKIIESGADSLKIEGRKRSPEYVAKTVSVYRQAIDSYFDGTLTDGLKKHYLEELAAVYNRGFSSGFYFDIPSSSEYADIYGSKATKTKQYTGKILNYYKKINVAYMLIEAGELNESDELLIIGPTTGVIEIILTDIVKDEINIKSAKKGDKITFPVPSLIRPHDAVYVVKTINKLD